MPIDAGTIIAIMAFFGTVALAVAVSLPFLIRIRRAERLKALVGGQEDRERRQQEELALRREQELAKRSRPKERAQKSLLQRLKLDSLLSPENLKKKLMKAGWRDDSAVGTYIALRYGAAIFLLLFAFLIMTLSPDFYYPMPGRMMIALLLGMAGFFLPDLLLKNATAKRRQALQLAFPDALDLLVICVQGGASIEAALVRVTDELVENAPEFSQEIGLLSIELAYLAERRQAYANFAERAGLQAAKSLTTTLLQSEKYGTPVGVALKVLAQENRDDRMARAEKKAAALPSQLTVPMLLFFIPSLFVVILGPPVLKLMGF